MKAPAAVAALAIAITSSALGAERLDCRYYRADEANPATMAEDPGPLEGLLLPDNDVFRPILADQRELRIEAVIDSSRQANEIDPVPGIRAADVTVDPNAAPSRAEADPRHNLERIVGGTRGRG